MFTVNAAFFHDIEAVGSPPKDSQLRPLRFWSKAIRSLENFSSGLRSDFPPDRGSLKGHVAGAAHHELCAIKLAEFNN